MKLCKDCKNRNKKSKCQLYTSMSNYAEQCKNFEPLKNDKHTNADRIRAMSDEELENLLNKAVFCGGLVRSEQSSAECKGCSYPFCSPGKYVEWLKRENV